MFGSPAPRGINSINSSLAHITYLSLVCGTPAPLKCLGTSAYDPLNGIIVLQSVHRSPRVFETEAVDPLRSLA